MTITRAQVWDALVDVATEKGPSFFDEHELPLLTYADGSHCLAGEALARLGVTLPPRDHRLNHRGVHTVALESLWAIDVDALDLLAAAQGFNDRGFPWMAAVAKIAQDEGLVVA